MYKWKISRRKKYGWGKVDAEYIREPYLDVLISLERFTPDTWLLELEDYQ